MLHEQVVLVSRKGVNIVCPHSHVEEEKFGAIGYHHGYNTCKDDESSDDKMSIKMSHNIIQTPDAEAFTISKSAVDEWRTKVN